MKICFLIEQWFPQIGGAEFHVLNLARQYAKQGIETTIIVRNIQANNKIHKKIEFFNNNRTQIIRIGLPTQFENNLGRIIYLVSSIAKVMALKNKFDIVHSHTYTGSISGLIVKKLTKIPSIVTLHSFHGKKWYSIEKNLVKSFIFEKMEKFILNNLNSHNHIITVSRNLLNNKKMKSSNLLKKISFVPNGCNINSNFSDKKPINEVIIGVGRLTIVKGFDILIKSFKIVLNDFPKSFLILIGDGPEKEQLMLLCKKLKIEKNVIFKGIISHKEVERELFKSQIYILPSRNEAFPLSIIEAWANFTCVIGTYVGEIPNLIINHKNGLIIPPQNIIELAEKIIYLLNNPQIRKIMANNGRNFVENELTWKIIANKTLSIYKNVLTT